MDNQDLMLIDIMDYISLKNPGGALLINGEWGCGKTYYINNTLIPMYEELVFVKVSLFGLNSYEDLISRVKEGYITQQIKEYGFEKYIKFDKNKVIKEIIQNLLPDKQKAVISALYQGLLGLGNTINGKKVVFIYDDLERVKLDSDIVFGFVNNQIENLKSSVIIIANEYEIIREESDNTKIYFSSYSVSQEKVIQRRIQFQEDYSNIITKYISETKKISSNTKYHEFLKESEIDIINMFMEKNSIRNLRSLFVALQNFEFIYTQFTENNLRDNDQLKGFLMSFLSYSIVARKCQISLNDDKRFDVIKKIYSIYFDNQYLWLPIEQWILTGDFNKELFCQYLGDWVKVNSECSPEIMIRNVDLCEMEDKDIEEGLINVLADVYSGTITFQEYIRFINNMCIARQIGYKYIFDKIEWSKVKSGINKLIFTSLKSNLDIQHPNIYFDKTKYTNEERECVELIEEFINKAIGGLKKKGEFLSLLQEEEIDWRKAIAVLDSYFDSEMACMFLENYMKANNKNKVIIQMFFLEYCKIELKNAESFSKQGVSMLYNLLKQKSELLTQQEQKYIELYNINWFLKALSEFV